MVAVANRARTGVERVSQWLTLVSVVVAVTLSVVDWLYWGR
ncbi:MAG: hypothetical protein ACK4JZ_04000 [Hydrogenophilus thermoluteolus]